MVKFWGFFLCLFVFLLSNHAGRSSMLPTTWKAAATASQHCRSYSDMITAIATTQGPHGNCW